MIIHMAYYLLNFGGCQGIPIPGEGGRRGIWGRLEENQGNSMQGAEVEIVQVT